MVYQTYTLALSKSSVWGNKMTDWTAIFKSQSDFIEAAFNTPEAALKAARKVQCHLATGEVLTVNEIIHRCYDHGQQPEAFDHDDWSRKTAQLIQSHIDMQEGVAKEALIMAHRFRTEFLRVYRERSQSPEVRALIAEMDELLSGIDRTNLYSE